MVHMTLVYSSWAFHKRTFGTLPHVLTFSLHTGDACKEVEVDVDHILEDLSKIECRIEDTRFLLVCMLFHTNVYLLVEAMTNVSKMKT
jgi:hypothetical protein